jgi:Tol biopolymer transport system component
MAYTTIPEGLLWRSRIDGADRIQLAAAPFRAALPAWSPDGSRIAFMGHNPGELWKIYTVRPDGTGFQRLTAGENDEADPGWSPDGAQVAFGHLSVGPSNAIHVFDLRTSRTATLPGSEGLFSPRWSPDGRFIVAMSADGSRLMIFEFASRRWRQLAGVNAGYPCWSMDGRYIYFVHRAPEGQLIVRVRVSDGRMGTVANLKATPQPATTFGRWIGLHPGGSLLSIRDLTSQQIYAFDWRTP